MKFHSFKQSSGIDGWLSNKGVLYFTVDGVNFANTHTQSECLHYCILDFPDNPSISKRQIHEIITYSPFGRNFILMGDLNNTCANSFLNTPENNTEYTFVDDKTCYDYIVHLDKPCVVSDVSVIKLTKNPSDHYPVVGFI